MRFMIIGSDAAGLPIELALEARSVDEAEHLASQRGVNVLKIHLAGNPTIEPTHTPTTTHRDNVVPTAASIATAPRAASLASAPGRVTMTTASSAPSTPTREPRRVVPATNRRVNLGLISITLAFVALLFCWIPTVGLISLPLCVVGLIAGVAGLLAASISRGGSGSYRPAGESVRFIAPAGGLALSGLALAATVMIATGPHSDAEMPAASLVSVSTPQRESRGEVPPAKPLAIVVSGREADTPGDLFKKGTAKAQAPVIAADTAPKQIGDAEFRIAACTLGEVPLVGEQGRSAGITTMSMMVIRVEVHNKGSAPITYTTLAGDESGLSIPAELRDENGLNLRRAKFGFAIVPVGRVASEVIAPGKMLVDVLVFERPAMQPAALTLHVPGGCIRASGAAELGMTVPVFR